MPVLLIAGGGAALLAGAGVWLAGDGVDEAGNGSLKMAGAAAVALGIYLKLKGGN